MIFSPALSGRGVGCFFGVLMKFPKKKRIINKQLLEDVKDQPCICCSKHPSDPHHLTSRGASGDDTEDNLLPLCRKHHTEIHQIGLKSMCWKFPKIKEWLVKMKRHDLLFKL